MRKFLNYALYASLLTFALTFSSCQTEYEELPGENEQETIMASSSTAQLVEKTVSNDGSFDNIVDGSSCFNVRFPYTVEVNGLELTINAVKDLELIEEIFDALEDDEDVLEILFPITITLGDYTEITINGEGDLREWAEKCIEGGDDDDIECIDFVYPITLFTFDINKQQTGNVAVESDMEMRRFFAGLDEEDLISIQFPVTLKLFDGTEIVVDSNAELANAIENAKEACDEDDDNDYNDDDFDEERLDFCLTQCSWLVKEVKRDGVNQTDQYFEYLMNFKEDGSVTVKDREGNNLEGTWSTRASDDGALLKMEFDVLVDFSLEWLVYEIEEHKIKLLAGEGNRIIMQQFCEEDNNPDGLREILRECSWIIKRVKNNGDHLNRLLGFEFEFMGDGVVTLSDGDTVSEGTWAITTNNEGRLVMAITMGDEPGVSFEWLLSDMKDRYLKFNVEGTFYELVLVRNCDGEDDDDGDVSFIRELFSDTEWEIALFSENGDDTTDAYNDVTLFIGDDGSLEVRNATQEVISNGRWFLYRNTENRLELIIAFGAGSNFYPLANDYIIVEVDESRLELKHENDDDGYDQLVLERIMQ
ncbi:hypothetical protein [Ulvibacterium sp.]|uniref:hypothetical protein n=1 Tax=Ulvibacterium sp. TaxID=2665914 RepID=UPI003CC592E4